MFAVFGGQILAEAYAKRDASKALPLLEEHVKTIGRLRVQILNTIDRQQAYLEADDLLGGTGYEFSENPALICQALGFDVTKFKN